jgi:hypothetical protein
MYKYFFILIVRVKIGCRDGRIFCRRGSGRASASRGRTNFEDGGHPGGHRERGEPVVRRPLQWSSLLHRTEV